MKDEERKLAVCVVVVFFLACVSVIGARRYEYLDELCRATSSPLIRLGFHLPKDHQAVVLSLSQAKYPTGLNCCLTIVSDSYIAAELSEVNLRRNEHCIDNLQVVTQTEMMFLCNQEDQVRNDPEDASRTVESKGAMKITFISNSSTDDEMLEENQSLGFTVRLLTFIKEKDESVCRERYHGFLCPRLGRCLPQSVICDGEEDCYSGKDESATICGDSTAEPPISGSSFYTSPSILSVILAVISTAFLLCICFWLVCASRRLMVDNTDGQIIWNLFGSNPGMTLSPGARFLRSVRSRQLTPRAVRAPPSTHSSTTVMSEVGTIQEQPPPPYESLFGSGQPVKETEHNEVGPL